MDLCDYNQGIVIPSTTTYYDLKNKNVDISYKKLQESAEVRIFSPINLCTTFNRSEIFNKSTLVDTLGTLYDVSYVVVQEEV